VFNDQLVDPVVGVGTETQSLTEMLASQLDTTNPMRHHHGFPSQQLVVV